MWEECSEWSTREHGFPPSSRVLEHHGQEGQGHRRESQVERGKSRDVGAKRGPRDRRGLGCRRGVEG